MKAILDIETGKIVLVELTDAELEELENKKQEIEKKAEILAEAAAAKNALLQKLGITEEEAKLLLS